MRFIASLIVPLLLVISGVASLTAQEQTVAFSDPDGPKRLEMKLINGAIHVIAGDVQHVVIKATDGRGAAVKSTDEASTKYPGMRRYRARGDFEVSESENTVRIRALPPFQNRSFDITVPRKIDLILSVINGPGIEIEGVEGKIDAKVVNGKLKIINVAGAVVAHCLNQTLEASFTRVDPHSAMSFTSLNGNVDVTFPRNISADVVLKSLRGEIVSDFELTLDTKEERLGGEVRGRINNGGPLMRLETFNGDVILRRREP